MSVETDASTGNRAVGCAWGMSMNGIKFPFTLDPSKMSITPSSSSQSHHVSISFQSHIARSSSP